MDVPWDLEPMLQVYTPEERSGYLLDDTVHVNALCGVYGGGSIDSFQLYVDDQLFVSLDTTHMDTIITGLQAGAHQLGFKALDDSGNEAYDSLKIYVGSVRYHLTLIPGTGEGEVLVFPDDTGYVEGTELTLDADPAFSYGFRDWSGDVNSALLPLTVTMDSDLELTANFARDTGLYVKINFQPETSEVPSGYLSDVGKMFGTRENDLLYGWVGTDNQEAIQRSGVDDLRKATFNQMQKNGDISWELGVPDGPYAVLAHMGDGRLTSQVNSIEIEGIEMIDTVPGNYFDEFYLDSVSVTDGALTIVPIGEEVKIDFIKIGSAGWKFGRYVTVIDGTGQGDYPVGSEVEIVANPAGGDLTFLVWTGDTVFMDDPGNRDAILVMPDQDLVVKANYWIPVYWLTVNNGTGSGEYESGKLVAIVADSPPEGQEFAGWEVVSGDGGSIYNSQASATFLIMPEEPLEIVASYQEVTGISSRANPDQMKLSCYPNPAPEEFWIQWGHEGRTTIRIFDLTGHLVYSEVSSQKVHRVIAPQLTPGIYQLTVSDEKGNTSTLKLIRQ
ncbi:MAG: InlB B-repeat-containing protein [Bacteroidales bacterium]